MSGEADLMIGLKRYIPSTKQRIQYKDQQGSSFTENEKERRNAVATAKSMRNRDSFQRCIELILREWKTVLIYLDDITLFSSTLDDYLEKLREVCQMRSLKKGSAIPRSHCCS